MTRRRKTTAELRDAAERSLTLLRAFVLASAGILLAGAVFLSWVLTTALRNQALAERRESVTQYVDGVLRPALVRGDRLVVGPAVAQRLLGDLRRHPDLVSVKVWRPDGTLAWTNLAAERIGRRYPLEGNLGRAIRENEATAEIDELEGEEDAVERRLALDHLLEVYAPLPSADRRRAIGAYEIYADPRSLESLIGRASCRERV